MRILTNEQFEALLKSATIKPRFKRDVKFRASTEQLSSAAWNDLELLPIWNRNKNGGILLLQPADSLYLLPFEIMRSAVDATGRSKPVICDLCYTWQPSSGGGFVTFYPAKDYRSSIALLCCLDLRCSDHIRTKTTAGLGSRTQLREDMTNHDRIERLKRRAKAFIDRLFVES